MKRFSAAILAFVVVCGLAGCSSDGNGSGTAALSSANELPASTESSPAAGVSPVAESSSIAESPAEPATTEPSDVPGASDVADASDAAAPAGDGPCALLDGADLETLLGGPAGDPVDGDITCTIKPSDSASVSRIDVEYRPTGGADAYESQNKLLGIDGPVAGLGDEAIQTGVRIHARKGEEFLMVQVIRFPTADVKHVSDDELLAFAQLIGANAGW